MGAFSSQYPADLRKVIEHAKRVMKVLNEIERVGTDRWFVGRAGELRGIVSMAIVDWRSGVTDADAASLAIRSYVDTLHRGAAQKLRCGWVLDCCQEDDVITAVAPGEAGPFTEGDTANTALTQIQTGRRLPPDGSTAPKCSRACKEGSHSSRGTHRPSRGAWGPGASRWTTSAPSVTTGCSMRRGRSTSAGGCRSISGRRSGFETP